MNPANDVGKRDLPAGLKSRMTEFWVESPDSNLNDLKMIIKRYLCEYLPFGRDGDAVCDRIADFYLTTKNLLVIGSLFDGANQKVHFSMR